MSKEPTPTPVHRRDYTPSPFLIDRVSLRFELDPEATRVHARLAVRRRQGADVSAALVLDGDGLTTHAVTVDGRPVGEEELTITETRLDLRGLGDAAVVETEVTINPSANAALEGLYRSSGNFCTQCEAEGFRRITWFADRPDVMAIYDVEIVAPRSLCPVMLSNGNLVRREDLGDGRQRVRWEDPHPKPSYLFALVAGDLHAVEDTFTTMEGREVKLEIWVEKQNLGRCEHAMRSLKQAMAWDERRFGRAYDLDIYMIVAVNDFNMGAMENKGLNVFNAKYVLADPETATDADYEGVESVIAHEYFHNWTGNRITCRDWFQLTLKEGLTVFRDQLFSGDMGSHAVKRIEDVKVLRASQFAEDAGPMAHPIRPDSYIEMNNFYTVTVYNKGAEVIRMLHTLLGEEGFRAGMDLYFERHDGQAVTCDDFVAAMADANDKDFEQFSRWYAQEGTPTVAVTERYDAAAGRLELEFEQRPPVNVAAEAFVARHLPVQLGLISPGGAPRPLSEIKIEDAQGQPVSLVDGVLELRDTRTSVYLCGVEEGCVPSVGRGFSAPVHFEVRDDPARLAFLMAHDEDPFNRWDSGQRLGTATMLALAERAQVGEALEVDRGFVDAWLRVLADDRLDPSMKALALELPSARSVGQQQMPLRPEALHRARLAMARALANAAEDTLSGLVRALEGVKYRLDREDAGRRRLANLAWHLRATARPAETLPELCARLESADNMTDASATLTILAAMDDGVDDDRRAAALAGFYRRWEGDPLVVDKWFRAQAMSGGDGALDRVVSLASHPAFQRKNPNRFRALVGAFGLANQRHFNARDGRGYAFVADEVLALDALNPQTAARVVAAFNGVGRLDAERRALVKAQLERILGREGLSRDVYEIASRTFESAFG